MKSITNIDKMRATNIHLIITVLTALINHLTVCPVFNISTSSQINIHPPEFSKFEIHGNFIIIKFLYFHILQIFCFYQDYSELFFMSFLYYSTLLYSDRKLQIIIINLVMTFEFTITVLILSFIHLFD